LDLAFSNKKAFCFLLDRVGDRSPKFLKIQKNGKVTIGKSWCKAAGFKSGAEIVIDEIETGRIVIIAR